MTPEGVEANGPRGKKRAPQEKFCSANVQAPDDMLAVVTQAK